MMFVEGKRYSQSFSFLLRCSKCHKKTPLQTSKSSGPSWQPRDATDINRRLFLCCMWNWNWQARYSYHLWHFKHASTHVKQVMHDNSNALHAAHKTAIEKHLNSTRKSNLAGLYRPGGGRGYGPPKAINCGVQIWSIVGCRFQRSMLYGQNPGTSASFSSSKPRFHVISYLS